MLPLCKQIEKLPLRILRDGCHQAISRISHKSHSQSKGETVLRLCRALLRVCEGVREGEGVGEGEAVMEVVKGLTMEIHESNRVELFLIKIRMHLLSIRWSRTHGTPPPKLISRAALFLEQMKTTPFYDSIASDYYSHIERLYLEVVREKLRVNSLGEAVRLMAGCLESLKSQFAALGGVGEEEKKVQALLQSKLELLQVLFRYEHAARTATSIADSQAITAQLLPKYERITQKTHSIHFPSDMLLTDCETLWIAAPTSVKQHSRRAQSIAQERSTNAPFNTSYPPNSQKHRESLQETAFYLDEFFRKRSNSTGQTTNNPPPITLPPSLKPLPPQTNKPSYFRREKLEHLNEHVFSEQKSEGVQSEKGKGKSKGSKKGKELIQPKKFKLVLEMDREARQKMIQLDPFASMKTEELHILTQKPITQVMVC